MGEIIITQEYDNSDKDCIDREIHFEYVNDGITYECGFEYCISNKYQSEFYNLSMNDIVLVVDDFKWDLMCPKSSNAVMEVLKSLIKDINKRFQIRIPVEIM